MKRNILQRSAQTQNASASGRQISAGDYRALGKFRQCLRKFLAFSEGAAKKRGLTGQQHQALLAIAAYPEPGRMSVGDLAECLMVKHHTAAEMVSRLKRADLVRAATDGDDRRRVLLGLTRRGRSKLDLVSRDNIAELAESTETLHDLLATVEHVQSRGTGSRKSPRRT